MSSGLPFHEIAPPPPIVTPGTVLARLVQGIGFRYRWATEGLAAGELSWRPVAGSMDLGEVLTHIHGLVRWVAVSIGVDTPALGPEGPGPSSIRSVTLQILSALVERFERMTEADLGAVRVRTSRGEALPFWNLVNGPLADTLTHIGQVASWRRVLGNPVPGADVFRGRPPPPTAAQ